MKKHVHKTFEEFLNGDKIDTIRLYHGTNLKYVESIQRDGLKATNVYAANWFMLSTDFNSALYHSTPDKDDFAYVFEFEIPYGENDMWKGYPYIWDGEKRNDNSTWFGLMKPIPPIFIKEIHKVPYSKWKQIKSEGF